MKSQASIVHILPCRMASGKTMENMSYGRLNFKTHVVDPGTSLEIYPSLEA